MPPITADASQLMMPVGPCGKKDERHCVLRFSFPRFEFFRPEFQLLRAYENIIAWHVPSRADNCLLCTRPNLRHTRRVPRLYSPER
jgi:hypothetical protein